VYTVGTIKPIPGIRTYLAVDGGMARVATAKVKLPELAD
jgi:hypothetical protein